MKKISISDLFETEDIFKGIRQSATDTIETLNKVQGELMNSAKIIKNDIKNSSTDSAKGLKEFTNAASAASKIMKDSAIVAKQLAQAEQQKIKVDQELVKLERLKAQEMARATKEAEKAAKLAANESSAYAKLSAELNKARKAYKDLAVTNQTNTAEAQDLLQTITKLDQQLKEVDATVGQHQRNVGNYEGAAANLKKELRDLTRQLQNMSTTDPRFQEMTQRAGELKDQISDTNAVIKATAGTGIENLAGSIGTLGQVGTAAFQGVEASMALMGVESENVSKTIMRMTALLNLSEAFKALGGIGDSITQIRAGFVSFGTKAIGAFKGMTTASKAFAITGIGLLITAISLAITYWDDISKAIGITTKEQEKYIQRNKALQEEAKKQREEVSKESASFALLISQLKNTNTNTKERSDLIKKINGQYGTTLKNMSDETAFQRQLNEELKSYLEYQRAKYTLQKNEDLITRNLSKQDELRKKLKKETELLRIAEEKYNKAQQGSGDYMGLASTQYENQKKKVENLKNELADTEDRFDSYGTSANKAQGKIDKVTNSGKKFGEQTKVTSQEIEDLRQRIYDEQIKQIEDLNSREQVQAIVSAQREIDSVNKSTATQKQKAELIKLIQENLNTELERLDNEYYAKQEAAIKEANQLRIQQENEFLDQIEALQEQNYQNTLTDEEKEIQAVNDKYFELETKAAGNAEQLAIIEQAKLNELNDINLKYGEQKKKTDEEIAAKEQEAIKKQWETMEDFAQKTTDFFVQKSNERIEQLDKEIEAAEKQSETLKTLAAEGNINAQQSLAEQERIIAESNLRKQQEQRKQQRLQLANSVFSTYASKVEAGSKNALAETIRDTTLLQAFINSIPAFYDGTEDTGSGGGLDGKGGFHAILHPHERVIPQSLNEKIGSLSNEQLTRIAQEYQNGKMVKSDVAHSSMELAVLVNEMKDLKEIIRNKPETNIELGQITQSSMEIVERTRKGNTTVYNRFKVRS